MLTSTAAGLLLGYAADRLLGDPARWHPVAGMGRAAAALESRCYADSRARGAAFTAVLVGGAAGIGCLRPRSVPLIALATWTALGGSSLIAMGERVADAVSAEDVEAARALIPSLCGRDPQSLDADGIIRAATESIAENTSDAAVAPLLWGAALGVPGLLGYRMANTLDAMVGYRNERYSRFGWASARLDDLLNYLPARFSGLAVIAAGGGANAWVAWRRDAAGHPSPNAGVVEASFAGALGVRLGGETVYPHRVEMRPYLGAGDPPAVGDLRNAVRLSQRVQLMTLAAVTVGQLALRILRRARRVGAVADAGDRL
nr:cobalamin biosynthesis protein [Jongsikchunia kroppenstedtii]